MRLTVSTVALLFSASIAQAQHDVTYQAPPPGAKEEFRYLGGALVCISERQTTPEEALSPCLHIGTLVLGGTVENTEATLGRPWKVWEADGGSQMRIYPLRGRKDESPYLAVAYKGGRIEAIQLSGDDTPDPYEFSSIKLGDADRRVTEILGPPSQSKAVAENGATLLSYRPFPISMEVRDKKVISIKIWQEDTEGQRRYGHTGDGSAQVLHVISQLPDGAEPVSPADLSKRIRDAAVQYQAYAPVPRVGFYDIAYPATEAEAKELNRYAVLLVTAICQEKAEIPLRRVYVEVAGKQSDLTLFGSVLSTVRKEDDPIGSTFGQNRVDSLYLIPIYAAAKRGLLLADFAKNRDGFKLGELKGPPSNLLKNWADSPTQGAKPSDKAIKDLIHREYPGFLAE